MFGVEYAAKFEFQTSMISMHEDQPLRDPTRTDYELTTIQDSLSKCTQKSFNRRSPHMSTSKTFKRIIANHGVSADLGPSLHR